MIRVYLNLDDHFSTYWCFGERYGLISLENFLTAILVFLSEGNGLFKAFDYSSLVVKALFYPHL